MIQAVSSFDGVGSRLPNWAVASLSSQTELGSLNVRPSSLRGGPSGRASEIRNNDFVHPDINISPATWSDSFRIPALDRTRADEIAGYYPETELDYLAKIFRFDLHHKSFSPSTQSKRVYLARHKSEVVGYIVVTRKTNNGTKLGPIWVHQSFRNRNIGSKLVTFAISAHPAAHYFMTVSKMNTAMTNLAVKSGFRNEYEFRDLYIPGHSELLFSLTYKRQSQVSQLDRRLVDLLRSLDHPSELGSRSQDNTIGLNFVRKRGGALKLIGVRSSTFRLGTSYPRINRPVYHIASVEMSDAYRMFVPYLDVVSLNNICIVHFKARPR